MKKLFYLLILLSISLNSYGLNFLVKDPKIDAAVINRIGTLLVEEKYKDCIDSCNNYLGYRYFELGYESHPCRDWRKNQGYWGTNDVMDIAKLMYLGCAAAYEYSLSNFDYDSIFDGLEWARACVAIYDDYLHERIPNAESTIDTWEQYVQYAENALTASLCGGHFLKAYREDSWTKKQTKWFDKKTDRILDVLYKNVAGKDAVFADNLLLQYKVFTLISNQIVIKGKFKNFQEVFKERLDAFERMINL